MSVKSLTPSCCSFRVFDLIKPWRSQRMGEYDIVALAYPSIVELCLYADIIAFFFEL